MYNLHNLTGGISYNMHCWSHLYERQFGVADGQIHTSISIVILKLITVHVTGYQYHFIVGRYNSALSGNADSCQQVIPSNHHYNSKNEPNCYWMTIVPRMSSASHVLLSSETSPCL